MNGEKELKELKEFETETKKVKKILKIRAQSQKNFNEVNHEEKNALFTSSFNKSFINTSNNKEVNKKFRKLQSGKNLSAKQETFFKKLNFLKQEIKVPLLFRRKYEEGNISKKLTTNGNHSHERNYSNIINNKTEIVTNRIKTSSTSTGNLLQSEIGYKKLKEILDKKCFDSLINKTKKNINEEEFNKNPRTILLREYEPSKNVILLKDIIREKNKEIHCSNKELIQYLSEKKIISTCFLKKLDSSNESKLRKLNKITAKFYKDKYIEEKHIEEVKKNIEIKNNKIQELIDKRIIKNKNVLKKSKCKTLYDTNKINTNLLKIHRDFINKYWKKSDNFSRLFPKKSNVHFVDI